MALIRFHFSSMSLNLVMMCGRLGGVAGTNAMAMAVFWHCGDLLLVQAALLAAAALGIWMICVKCELKQSVVH